MFPCPHTGATHVSGLYRGKTWLLHPLRTSSAAIWPPETGRSECQQVGFCFRPTAVVCPGECSARYPTFGDIGSERLFPTRCGCLPPRRSSSDAARCPRIRMFWRRCGFEPSWSRTHRLWKQGGLFVPRERPGKRVAAARPPNQTPFEANMGWPALVFDTTATGQQIKCPTVVDELTRECCPF